MKSFGYELLQQNGQRSSGKVLARDKRDALTKLRTHDCKIIRLELEQDTLSKQAGQSIGLPGQILFTANLNLRLAGQLKAGIPLRKALENIKAVSKGKYQQGLQEVVDTLDAGRTFSEALSARRDLFPDFMCSMVSVGEHTGALAEMLQDVADYYFDLYEIRTHLKQVSLYPLFLCTLIFLLLLAFIEFVVPSFASLYTMLNIDLHGVLRGLLLLREHLLLIILAGILSLVVAVRHIRSRCRQNSNYLMDIAVRAPVIGHFAKVLQEVRFCRVVSMQLRVGVDLLTALQIARNCITGTAMQHMLDQVTADLTRGVGLYETALAHNTFLSDDTLEFISVGEDGNGYAQMLELAHTQARGNLKNISASIKTYAQPLIFLLTALTLGAVIVILLQPMLGVLENVGNNW